MNNVINKINVNGRDYLISAEGGEIVKELPDMGDGSNDIIFVGLMDHKDVESNYSYSYFSDMLTKDNVNNKVFRATTLPITVRTNFESKEGKHPFIMIPKNHPNLYMLSIPSQQFTGWEDDYREITIDFPTGEKAYKIFIFGNNLYFAHLPITYTF